ncbi:histidine phosphatase family protein [Pseudonocardiaceae bacterium YIM PH 21723]|nr:histidine phosphatase family protein [Pseudonocardiaceae bacterium YIM PH 21723]
MSLDRLVLWRHGVTEYNATGRIQGHLDVQLKPEGVAQAAAAAPLLSSFNPQVIVSSDLRRAADTAAAFARLSGRPIRFDKRLRETYVGQWQGLTHAEVEEGWPGGFTRWRQDPTWAPPDGETRIEVADRGHEVISELDAELFGGTALICAHGGLLSSLTGRLLGLPSDFWPQLGGLSNCHWTVLERRADTGGTWRLISYNVGVHGDRGDQSAGAG